MYSLTRHGGPLRADVIEQPRLWRQTHDRPPTEANPPVMLALGARNPRTIIEIAPDYTGGKGLGMGGPTVLGRAQVQSQSLTLWAYLGPWLGRLAVGRAGSALGLQLGRVASHPHDFHSYDAGPKIESSLLHMSHSRSSPQPLSHPTAHARTGEACQSPWQFLLPFPPKEPEAERMPMQQGNPRCQVGYIYWDASARGYVHPRFCSLIIPPNKYIRIDRHLTKQTPPGSTSRLFLVSPEISCKLPFDHPTSYTQHKTIRHRHRHTPPLFNPFDLPWLEQPSRSL